MGGGEREGVLEKTSSCKKRSHVLSLVFLGGGGGDSSGVPNEELPKNWES